jgi:hypothetical protein
MVSENQVTPQVLLRNGDLRIVVRGPKHAPWFLRQKRNSERKWQAIKMTGESREMYALYLALCKALWDAQQASEGAEAQIDRLENELRLSSGGWNCAGCGEPQDADTELVNVRGEGYCPACAQDVATEACEPAEAE